ncbi:helix-turn-helix domain-containing protein [Lacticaseibacillus paracasei]|uniref:helix-turn-helix domain-containing protein n=1 Tax=Lacticaseibacillus paracasei TaxID=1597 RepID=UPI003857ED06
MNVGERMKTIRKQKGISADSLAAKIGVSRSTVFRYEKGDIEKVPSTAITICGEINQTRQLIRY